MKFKPEKGILFIPDGETVIDQQEYENKKSIQKVVCPSTLKKISCFAFSKCVNLKEVELNDGLEEIGACAFDGTAIESITIPKTVHKIGDSSFRECSLLRDVKILSPIEILQESMFSKCSSLESIELPDTIKVIGDRAFFNCTMLQKCNMPKDLEVINEFAFDSCNRLEGILFSDKLKEIQRNAFYKCESLTELIFPKSLKIIGDSAFWECKNVDYIYLNNGLEHIGKYAFLGNAVYDDYDESIEDENRVRLYMPETINQDPELCFPFPNATLIFKKDAPYFINSLKFSYKEDYKLFFDEYLYYMTFPDPPISRFARNNPTGKTLTNDATFEEDYTLYELEELEEESGAYNIDTSDDARIIAANPVGYGMITAFGKYSTFCREPLYNTFDAYKMYAIMTEDNIVSVLGVDIDVLNRAYEDRTGTLSNMLMSNMKSLLKESTHEEVSDKLYDILDAVYTEGDDGKTAIVKKAIAILCAEIQLHYTYFGETFEISDYV